MKQFNLEEYLANPNRKVVTRDGHPARIICTDRKGSNQPILALVQVRADPIEVALTFGTDGTYDIGRESCYDLFFATDKPKVERFDPNTLQPFDKVLVRTNHKGFWSCDLYSHINYEYMANVVCVGDVWEMCIPYNDDTKHLLGTTDDCPEYYKWWEEEQ